MENLNWIRNELKNFAMKNDLDEQQIIFMINFIEKFPS